MLRDGVTLQNFPKSAFESEPPSPIRLGIADPRKASKGGLRAWLTEAIQLADLQGSQLEIIIPKGRLMNEMVDVLSALGRTGARPVTLLMSRRQQKNKKFQRFLQMHGGRVLIKIRTKS